MAKAAIDATDGFEQELANQITQLSSLSTELFNPEAPRDMKLYTHLLRVFSNDRNKDNIEEMLSLVSFQHREYTVINQLLDLVYVMDHEARDSPLFNFKFFFKFLEYILRTKNDLPDAQTKKQIAIYGFTRFLFPINEKTPLLSPDETDEITTSVIFALSGLSNHPANTPEVRRIFVLLSIYVALNTPLPEERRMNLMQNFFFFYIQREDQEDQLKMQMLKVFYLIATGNPKKFGKKEGIKIVDYAQGALVFSSTYISETVEPVWIKLVSSMIDKAKRLQLHTWFMNWAAKDIKLIVDEKKCKPSMIPLLNQLIEIPQATL